MALYQTTRQSILVGLVALFVCVKLRIVVSQRTGGASANNKISIGFVYCEPEELLRAEQVTLMLNKEPSQKPMFIELKSHRLSLADNTLSMSLIVCDKLMGKTPLYAIMIARTDCIKVLR